MGKVDWSTFSCRVKARRDARKKPALSKEELQNWLSYDSETGIFIWRRSAGRVKRGDVAGCVGKDGYICIGLKGRVYTAGRLAYLWMTGEWPDEIDHLNGHRTDNRWLNLRNVTAALNHRNYKKLNRNSSGTTGVSRAPNTVNRWRARIMYEGKALNLGTFATKQEAIAARQKFVDDHPEFGFTKRHGN
jgi:hypothetical protein